MRVRKALKTILLPAFLTLFGLFLSVVLIEVALRILPVGTEVAWNDRPAFYLSDERATTLQDYPHTPEKAEGVFRIAVVGDSFTFAPYMQFDDAFPKRLERWFNLNANQRKVEVINYGVPRYSTSHEVDLVSRAIREQADLIILQITLNDPEIKPYRPTSLIAVDPTGRTVQDRSGQLVLRNPLFRHSKALRFIATRLYNRYSRESYKQYFFNLFDHKKNWDSFRLSLSKIDRMATKYKVPLVAVVFPLFGFPNDDQYPFHPIHQKIADLLTSLQVPSLDLFQSYKGIPLDRLTVMPGKDRHPNEIAHRIAAESIYSWLEQQKVVPQELFAKIRVPERIGITIPSPLPPVQ